MIRAEVNVFETQEEADAWYERRMAELAEEEIP